MPSLNLLAVSALLPLLCSVSYAQGPAPYSNCSGAVSYCAFGSAQAPIILRCTGTILQPGNCDDNTGEPASGALCVEMSPTAGDAFCSIVGSSYPPFPTATSTTTSSSTSTSTPAVTTPTPVSFTATPGQPNPTAVPFGPCVGNVAYCASGSDQSPIILRCTGTILQPGNCDDNTGEPANGALCIEMSPTAGDAVCSAIGSPFYGFPTGISGSAIPSSAASTTTTVSITTTVSGFVNSTSTASLGPTISSNSSMTMSTTVSPPTPTITPSQGTGSSFLAGADGYYMMITSGLALLGLLVGAGHIL